MAPRAVLMKTSLKSVNTARPVNTVRSSNTGRPFSTTRSFNTVRPSYTAHPKSTIYCARPRTYFQNQAQSTVNTGQGDLMLKNRVVDHVSKNISASVTLKRLDYIDAQGRFKSVMAWMDAQIQGRQECSKEKEESREECNKSRKTKKMKCLRGISHKENEDKFKKLDDLKFTMSYRHQELTSQEQTATALASPKQMAIGKDYSNPFIAGYANNTNRDSTVSPSINTAGQSFTNADDLSTDPLMAVLEDTADLLNTNIFNGAYNDEDVGAEAELNNLETTMNISEELAMVSYIKNQRRTNHKDYQNCLVAYFLSQIEPKKVTQALQDPSWIEAMQDELLQFSLQKVWRLVDLPKGKHAIGTKWVHRNKKDERRLVVRNKARLVAQGYT
ncbi:putative ribonuclease H-like domain-containing protein [Tanacetum coccineum]